METGMRRTARESRTRSRSSASAHAAWRGVRCRLALSWARSTGGGAAEQAVRTPDQDHDHDGVDHERPQLRHIVFAGDIADAEQQGLQKRAGYAGRTAD